VLNLVLIYVFATYGAALLWLGAASPTHPARCRWWIFAFRLALQPLFYGLVHPASKALAALVAPWRASPPYCLRNRGIMIEFACISNHQTVTLAVDSRRILRLFQYWLGWLARMLSASIRLTAPVRSTATGRSARNG